MAPTGRNTSIVGLVPRAASWFLLLLGAMAATVAVPPKSPVYVTASFQDKNGLFLESLSRTDIEVSEDGTLREVEFLAMDQLPVVYGLIFEKGLIPDYQWQDRKTEIHEMPGIKSAQDLAYELIDKRLGQQAVWVGAYDEELEVLLEPTTDGFRAKEAVHGLRGARRPESFLYAALFSAVQKMGERPEKRRVLVVFLDQIDGKTAGKIQPLKNLLSKSNVELFTLCFGSKTGAGRDGLSAAFSQAALRDLAKVTCGDVFFASNYRDHLEDVSRRLLGQIRTLHTMGFESEADAEKGAKLLIRCSVAGSRVKHHASVPVFP